MRFLTYFFSLIIGALGALTFIEYISGMNLGIDNLIFRNAFDLNNLPVRMSPQSTISFFLLGLSLLLIEKQSKNGKRPSQYIILAVGIIALFSFFGFIHNVSGFYTISPYKGMAAHTAVAFILLFAAIFIGRPNSGLMKTFSSAGLSGYVARRLFVTLFILIIFDILVMTGHASGAYTRETEAVIHVILLVSAFIYLMFIGFGSLDKIQSIEEIDRAKTEFVSFVSHQLRNPLTAIKWSAGALLNDPEPLNEKQKDRLIDINHSASRTINLINSFLNISKIEKGTFIADTEKVNLPALVDDCLGELYHQIKQKHLAINKDYKTDLPVVTINRKLAQIVLQNLLSNSIKYTPANGKISIGIHKTGSEIKIKVSDNGIGIPPSQQARVFSKLFRAENIKEKTEGSGLGLYMTKILLEKANGKIWFSSRSGSAHGGESEQNKGTTFYATIPINQLTAKQ